MNSENLKFLNERLKYLGFKENTLLNQQLKERIVEELPAFELYTDEYFDHFTRLEAKLFFYKIDKKEIYVFDKYEATLYYDRDPGKEKKQTFRIIRGKGVTLKQAFNLLQGRSAYIDHVDFYEVAYETWANLDFEERDAWGNFKLIEYRHGFDLEKVLEMYPIRELQTKETKESLIAALQRGNLHQVTFDQKAKPEVKLITADPGGKTIKIYNPASGAGKKKEIDGKLFAAKNIAPAASDPVNEEEEGEEDPVSAEETVTAKPGTRKAMQK
ncbi:MAG TPA: hypothetical protein VG052_03640 [Puia sp.]|jgi:hypothetical protein|nr:hypothetical protein [Puia sp.]